MKIGIYREFLENASGLGGAEFIVAALAEAFEEQHDVEVIHNLTPLTPEGIEAFFGIKLQRTRFRFEDGIALGRPATMHRSRLPWMKCREAVNWNSHLSDSYDLFICLTHFLPPFCHARTGLLLVLFPAFDRSLCWPWKEASSDRRPMVSRAVNLATQIWIWKQRFQSYRHRYAISDFTRRWTKRWWDVDCGVLYPPVDIRTRPQPKQPVILSIARFTPVKQQLQLVRAFGDLARGGLGTGSITALVVSTRLRTTGATSRKSDARQDRCQSSSSRTQAGRDLESSLGSAQIFWHAMGYDKDSENEPSATEHFGIATVEAMAWGCVPVVINRGGQPEIVRHGVDGFLWDTLEELVHYTRLLMEDDELRSKMSESAGPCQPSVKEGLSKRSPISVRFPYPLRIAHSASHELNFSASMKARRNPL